jgi:hypothetical protein
MFSFIYFSSSGIHHSIPSPSFIYMKANAHSFTPNDYATFMAAVDQFQTELNLVQINSDNNNLQFLQEHTEKASKLFYRNLISEFAERDQKNADNITAALETLQRISSNFSMKDHQVKLNQIVSDIHNKADEITIWSLEQRQKQSQQEEGVETRFFNTITGFFNNLFGSSDAELKTQFDIETQPLRLAELVDFVLIDYGEAFNVDYDMTDMTNMMQMSENYTSVITHNMSPSSDNISLMQMDNTTTKELDIRDHMSKNHNIITDMGTYQSANLLSAKALEIFESELKPLATDDDSKAFVTNLESGITKFHYLVRDKAPPMDLMMVVHTQIHPNILQAYNIDLL